jgi:hypothetical protein
MAGIKSGSCRRLVGAAMEFATLDKMKAELQDVVSEDFFPDPKTFLNFAKDLKPSQILDLQELALQMDRRGQTDISKRLTSLINKLGRQRYLAPSAREARAMEEAISQFFPKAGAAHSHPLITAVNDELKGKYYSALLISHYDEDLVKKAKNDAGELPVSIQFDKEQRTRNVRIAGGLIDGHSIPNQSDEKTRRTQEFVNVMREKKFTDLQIMKASHIACQNTCSVLASLIYEENMLALNDFEKEQGGDAAKGISNAGLIPTGLEQDAHLNRNSNGNLEMRVQIFKEKVETWRGMRPEDCITTDPLNSSFLAELNFVIDEKGEVITEATTFQMGYQREITQIGPQE